MIRVRSEKPLNGKTRANVAATAELRATRPEKRVTGTAVFPREDATYLYARASGNPIRPPVTSPTREYVKRLWSGGRRGRTGPVPAGLADFRTGVVYGVRELIRIIIVFVIYYAHVRGPN